MFAATAHASTLVPPLSISDDDRRDCPRVPVEQITLRFGGRAFSGWGDLSTGGALWIGPAPRVLRGRIELELEIPGSGTVRVAGEIVSAREELDGLLALHLRFVDLPFETERTIARHVDECMLLTGAHLNG